MSKCPSCSTAEFIAEHVDAFTTANSLLKNASLPSLPDNEPVYTFENVMVLACFLIGLGDD